MPDDAARWWHEMTRTCSYEGCERKLNDLTPEQAAAFEVWRDANPDVVIPGIPACGEHGTPEQAAALDAGFAEAWRKFPERMSALGGTPS
jgi:hypothetical protein